MTSTSEVGGARINMVSDVAIVCERCEGAGDLFFEVASHLNYVRWDSVRCPDCRGVGEVIKNA